MSGNNNPNNPPQGMSGIRCPSPADATLERRVHAGLVQSAQAFANADGTKEPTTSSLGSNFDNGVQGLLQLLYSIPSADRNAAAAAMMVAGGRNDQAATAAATASADHRAVDGSCAAIHQINSTLHGPALENNVDVSAALLLVQHMQQQQHQLPLHVNGLRSSAVLQIHLHHLAQKYQSHMALNAIAAKARHNPAAWFWAAGAPGTNVTSLPAQAQTETALVSFMKRKNTAAECETVCLDDDQERRSKRLRSAGSAPPPPPFAQVAPRAASYPAQWPSVPSLSAKTAVTLPGNGGGEGYLYDRRQGLSPWAGLATLSSALPPSSTLHDQAGSMSHPPRATMTEAFGSKMYRLLNECSRHPLHCHAVDWAHHGTGFIIYDEVVFMRDVSPRFFAHGSIQSLKRQLRHYDFKLHVADNSYSHPGLQRGRPELLGSVRRVK